QGDAPNVQEGSSCGNAAGVAGSSTRRLRHLGRRKMELLSNECARIAGERADELTDCRVALLRNHRAAASPGKESRDAEVRSGGELFRKRPPSRPTTK